ncbi:hypothetical protein [Nonomuraea sp. GTA35]|uniref:hypothetical protein n=1 Tax=Nonomuraea sp. GTA35 TaxID=1676746 RepID=UPI0035C0CCAB
MSSSPDSLDPSDGSKPTPAGGTPDRNDPAATDSASDRSDPLTASGAPDRSNRPGAGDAARRGDAAEPEDADDRPHRTTTPTSRVPRAPRVLDQVPSVIGFVCGAVAVLYLPVLFGLAGVVLGVVGHARGEPLGRWAAIAAGTGMLLGTLLSILLTPS